jgi:phage portal protein BeeE
MFGFLRKIFKGQLSSGVANPEQWLVDALGGGNQANAGVNVTLQKTLGLPAVWNAVNIRAGHMAGMPLHLMRKTGDRWEPMTNHPAHTVLNVNPGTDLYTPFVLRQALEAHSILAGNGRAYIERNGLGQPIALLLLPPEATYSVMVNGEKWHSVYFDTNYIPMPIPFGAIDSQSGGLDGSRRSGLYNIPDRDILHLPNLGWSGLWGTSLVQLAKETFGNALAGQEAAGFQFRNNGHPSLLLQAPQGILTTQKEADAYLTAFKRGHEGLSNRAKVGLLREGVTASVLPISAQDAQFIESQRFNQNQIALLLGMEYLMGEASAVYKDLAERQAAYVVNTLAPKMQMYADECFRKLLSVQQQQSGNYEFRFDPRVLMRGSPNTLADYTGKLRQQGVISGNEAREIHNFNPVDDEALETFSNPNVTTPEDNGETTEEPPAEEPEETTEEPQNRVDPLDYLFRDLITYEQNSIRQRAAKGGNFLKQTDEFYKGYETRLIRACRDLGISEDVAKDHCDDSQNDILEVAGMVSADGLKDSIHEVTEDWPNRSKAFSNV